MTVTVSVDCQVIADRDGIHLRPARWTSSPCATPVTNSHRPAIPPDTGNSLGAEVADGVDLRRDESLSRSSVPAQSSKPQFGQIVGTNGEL